VKLPFHETAEISSHYIARSWTNVELISEPLVPQDCWSDSDCVDVVTTAANDDTSITRLLQAKISQKYLYQMLLKPDHVW